MKVLRKLVVMAVHHLEPFDGCLLDKLVWLSDCHEAR